MVSVQGVSGRSCVGAQFLRDTSAEKTRLDLKVRSVTSELCGHVGRLCTVRCKDTTVRVCVFFFFSQGFSATLVV